MTAPIPWGFLAWWTAGVVLAFAALTVVWFHLGWDETDPELRRLVRERRAEERRQFRESARQENVRWP